MARITHVKAAQQRYATVPVIDPETGQQKVTAVKRKSGDAKVTKRGREVTRRVTIEDRSQPLPLRDCGYCHQPIEVGTPYKWVSIKSGPYGGRTMYRHEACPTWKQSELTTSKMSGIYAAQEMVAEQIDNCEDEDALSQLASDAAEAIREVASEYGESADNMEEGFGHETSSSADLRDKSESLESWADEIEGLDFDAFEEPEADEETEGFDAEEHALEVETAREEWLEEQRTKLTDEVDNCPV